MPKAANLINKVDAINYIGKAPGFPDAEIVEPWSPHQPAMHLYLNRPKCHQFLRELSDCVLCHYDIMTVGETPYVDEPQLALQFVHPDRHEFCMIFPWEHMDVDRVPDTLLGWRPIHPPEFKAIINKWQTTMQENGGWNSLYMENHDQARSISRFGSDKPEFRQLSGKLLAMFLATLSGTLYIFQGQEIGMINLPKDWEIEEYTDVVSEMHYAQEKDKKRKATGDHEPDMSNVMSDIQKKARDHARTPMPWSGTMPNAGFTSGTPWRKTNPDFTVCNVEDASRDPDSVLAFWKEMVQARKKLPTLIYGDFELLEPMDDRLFVYRRSLGQEHDLMVMLNFSENQVSLSPIEIEGDVVLGNYKEAGDGTTLRPWEAMLIAL